MKLKNVKLPKDIQRILDVMLPSTEGFTCAEICEIVRIAFQLGYHKGYKRAMRDVVKHGKDLGYEA